jgi:hypothetical protein
MRTRIIVAAAVLGIALTLGTSAAEAREFRHWAPAARVVRPYAHPVYHAPYRRPVYVAPRVAVAPPVCPVPAPVVVAPPACPAPVVVAPYRYSYQYYDWLRAQTPAVVYPAP